MREPIYGGFAGRAGGSGMRVISRLKIISRFLRRHRRRGACADRKAEPKITDIARMIKERRILPEQQVNGKDKISSGLVNTIFILLWCMQGNIVNRRLYFLRAV